MLNHTIKINIAIRNSWPNSARLEQQDLTTTQSLANLSLARGNVPKLNEQIIGPAPYQNAAPKQAHPLICTRQTLDGPLPKKTRAWQGKQSDD